MSPGRHVERAMSHVPAGAGTREGGICGRQYIPKGMGKWCRVVDGQDGRVETDDGSLEGREERGGTGRREWWNWW